MTPLQSRLFELVLLVGAFTVLCLAAWELWRTRSRDRGGVDGAIDDELELASVVELGPVRRRLVAAGFRNGVALFVSLCLVGGALTASLVLRLLPGRWGLLLALAAGGLAAYLLWAALGTLGRLRAVRFERGLADASSFLVGALEAGENPEEALLSAAHACQDPVRRELLAVSQRLDMGMRLERALHPMALAYDSPSVRLFNQTLIAKWPVGGELAHVLSRASRTIVERHRLRWQAESQLAGARIAAWMVAVMPYVVVPFYFRFQPMLLEALVESPLGLRLLVAAVLLQVLGLLWLSRLVKVEL